MTYWHRNSTTISEENCIDRHLSASHNHLSWSPLVSGIGKVETCRSDGDAEWWRGRRRGGRDDEGNGGRSDLPWLVWGWGLGGVRFSRVGGGEEGPRRDWVPLVVGCLRWLKVVSNSATERWACFSGWWTVLTMIWEMSSINQVWSKQIFRATRSCEKRRLCASKKRIFLQILMEIIRFWKFVTLYVEYRRVYTILAFSNIDLFLFINKFDRCIPPLSLLHACNKTLLHACNKKSVR